MIQPTPFTDDEFDKIKQALAPLGVKPVRIERGVYAEFHSKDPSGYCTRLFFSIQDFTDGVQRMTIRPEILMPGTDVWCGYPDGKRTVNVGDWDTNIPFFIFTILHALSVSQHTTHIVWDLPSRFVQAEETERRYAFTPTPEPFQVDTHGRLLTTCPVCRAKGATLGTDYAVSHTPGSWITPDTFDFGTALRLLKEGKRVAREGWNGKGMYLFLGKVSEYVPATHYLHNGCLPDTTRSCIFMHDAQGMLVPGWLASHTDMLAEDWVVVP